MNHPKCDKKIRIDEIILNQLKDISEKEGFTISFIVRTILTDYIKVYLKNNTSSNDEQL